MLKDLVVARELVWKEVSVRRIMTDSLDERKMVSMCNLVVICYCSEILEALEEVIVTK
jgi:hypothetical protein